MHHWGKQDAIESKVKGSVTKASKSVAIIAVPKYATGQKERKGVNAYYCSLLK